MVYQYIERTAIPAWGPQQSEPLLAAGTVAGAMDATFSNTSSLELFRLSASEDTAALEAVGKATASARFQRLAWSGKVESGSLGVLAGGLENGDITVWDPAKILSGEDEAAVLHSSAAHTGAVGGLEFNPFQANLMASGAGNGEVFIWDIVSEFKSYSPGARSQRIENVTDLSWNNQVQHILATASDTGALVVWDLRSRREVIALNGPGVIGSQAGGARGGISAAVWNPASATQIVTASSDDNNPVIMLWDLRNANAPSQTFAGHQRGILSLSWCRKDPGLLLSSGKDNRTVCWNPATGEIVGELPPSNNWVYDVQWNQANPNLLSGASFDGRVSLYSLAREGAVEEAVATDDPFAPQSTSAFAPSLSLKRPPKWLARPCGAAFGFGGQLVHFGQQQQGALVSITEFVSEPELAQQARQLEELLQDDRAAELCRERLEQSRGSDQERSWQVLQILFESDARDKLVRFLGFDKEEVKGRIAELIKAKRAVTEAEEAVEAAAASEQAASEAEAESEAQSEDRSEEQDSAAENPFASSTSLDADADDFFSKPIDVSVIDSTAATVGSAEPSVIESSADASVRALRLAFSGPFHIYDKRKDIALEDADGLITRAVLLGDIEAAVELCIEQEQFADALILATCGSAELAQRVQQAYFARRAQQASYVRLLHGIVLGDLGDVVGNGDLDEWDQIMALLCTYAQGDRFSTLCEQLGARLEQAGQLADAVLCYLASGNLDKVARIWIAREQALVGLQRVRALHAVVEKVSVFRKAVQFVDPAVSSEDSPVFELGALYDAYAEYAAFLASQGMFDIAARYLERTPAAYRCYLPTGEDALAALRNRLAISPDVPWTPAPVGADYEAQEKAAALAQGQAQAQALVQQQAQMQAQAQILQQQKQQPQMQARTQIPQQQQHQFAAASNVYGSAPTYGMPGAQHYPSGPAYGMTQYAAANTFPPPPQPLNPASIPTGNTPPPRREEAAWNDPPMVAKPAKRALPPAAAAIATPFPQGRGTPPPAAMTPFGGPPPPTAQQQQQQMPPRGGFVPTANKPLPAAPAAQMMHPQQQQQPGFMPSTQQQQPGFMALPTQQMQQPVSTQPTRGQVVSATPAQGATPVNAKSPVPQQQQQQQQQTTKYPAGDRSHMPAEWVKVVGSLGAHLARAKQFAAPAQKRMVEDADRRLSLLFDLMNCAEVKPQLVAGFEQLCAALDARQFPQALQCQAELMALGSEITSNLVGVKHLINVLKTLPM